MLLGSRENERPARIRAAISGPSLSAVIAILAGLTVFDLDGPTKDTLDSVWFLLPLVALSAWVCLTWWLSKDLPSRDRG